MTRLDRLTRRYHKDVAAVKRAESRLTRAFNAWQKARARLSACQKLLEKDEAELHRED